MQKGFLVRFLINKTEKNGKKERKSYTDTMHHKNDLKSDLLN